MPFLSEEQDKTQLVWELHKHYLNTKRKEQSILPKEQRKKNENQKNIRIFFYKG